MILGIRGSCRSVRAWRCLVVWSSGTSALTAAALLGRRAARQALGGALVNLPLDQALVDLAALVLLACLAWGWLALTFTVGEAMKEAGASVARERRQTHPLCLPGGLRRLVLAGCGVALASGMAQPALAAGSGRPHVGRGSTVLVGLPLPDRAVTSWGHSPAPEQRVVVVRPGDCLWSIAAGDLPASASGASVAAHSHALYALNRALIGPDPDLLEPGQRLRLPRRELP